MLRSKRHIILPALICLVLGAAGGVATALVTDSAPAEPVRFTVPREPPPNFRLRDENGVWRTPASARGDVLLVTFIFTRCRDLCPMQAAEIKEAVVAAGGGVQVYAISVDPENDTPEQAHAWLRKMGVEGGPVRLLLGSRSELEPVWQRFGIVPIAHEPREPQPPEQDQGGPPPAMTPEEMAAARERALEARPAPEAARNPYPEVGDGDFRGRARHAGGLDYEHSAYLLVIDKQGRQRVGFPFEQITSAQLLEDIRLLKAEA